MEKGCGCRQVTFGRRELETTSSAMSVGTVNRCKMYLGSYNQLEYYLPAIVFGLPCMGFESKRYVVVD